MNWNTLVILVAVVAVHFLAFMLIGEAMDKEMKFDDSVIEQYQK